MRAELLARRDEGWVWVDDRVPVDEAFPSPSAAVEAGAEAIRALVRAGELSRAEAAELVGDARFELGAHEHHLGAGDADAIEALADLENELRDG